VEHARLFHIILCWYQCNAHPDIKIRGLNW